MITVHMVGNAHLDPVWLWRKEDGVDAVLATARSACDRLDEYPEFVFTCSTSWFHRQVEQLAPALWARVKRFVQQGRWRLVGGMVVQPDCNLPDGASFDKQLELGQRFYEQAFGQRTDVGYNVDSFGHTAWLPQRLRRAGIDAYCFMRPGPHEMDLPGDFFRWVSPDGSDVTAFRIGSYGWDAADLRPNIERSVRFLPPGAGHTMCFYGVGDHGGGPTKAQIEWLLAHGHDPLGDGSVRAVFSHPRACFDALAAQQAAGTVALPRVEGELQHHAIGCYAVERRIKLAMRWAEGRLQQAQQAADLYAPNDAAIQSTLDDAGETLCFNQFHDILGGTCLWPASTLAAAELTAAGSKAHDALVTVTRRATLDLVKSGVHQIVAVNPADTDFDGWIAHELWIQSKGEELEFKLLDEQGHPVPVQPQDASCLARMKQLLFPLTIPARSRRVLELRTAPAEKQAVGCRPKAVGATDDSPHDVPHETSAAPTAHSLQPTACFPTSFRVAERDLHIDGWRLRLDVADDPTDTWSHSAGNRFADDVLGTFAWSQTAVANHGPLRTDVRTLGQFDRSHAWARAMFHRENGPNANALSLRLLVTWAQTRQRLVLRLIPPMPITQRTDLVSGGPLSRPLNGCEFPLGGGMIVHCGPDNANGANGKANAAGLTLAAPDVFSASVTPEGIALTLLRSPLVAHHDPYEATQRPDQPATDQGSHEFHLTLWPNATLTPERLTQHVTQHLQPPVVWDVT